MIRITKEFKFEMAHALHGYDGLCKNIHGHSYKLWVTIRAKVRQEKAHKKDGMVMDFDVLKSIVKPDIIDKYDHSLVLNANSPHAEIDFSAFEKVFFLPYQPTSENLVMDFALKIKSKLPEGIELYKVVISETATSFAEWNCEDN
ncbi:MAG: 6-carboxytetrahydropterin synthase [Bacteroidetes bacterium]|jgi:6-pyruvoyltetrahydropterin/6-carboxytetrahydropterin synthase|nr:MAG: 6-pyruvoyl tetrahydropterin synthase [Cryomorphaceae bacterium BACL11 MAG-121001-bin54]KRO65354.1 MAG: 6-pyruvoyl tetrahydropterin synthase [Cryomorphaceae bacterium BACL11 MAG-121015-bin20]KRO70627.1 MAG: 6-pyruvoyl tetrahydropterin synthase [Cryomorphaceae bacterium BACL11 MAG-121128-bin16]MBC8474330.1 6-carboxytetrahydropterin synthase [Cryomorphaceae bacterium]MDA0889766.1 6-carboxytetrahydropterin synthase [Bacteroidota bacterium]